MLSELGWRVALVGRREAALNETGSLLKAPWLAIVADVGDAAQIAGAVRRAVETWGRLDALINNAGVAPMLAIEQTTPAVIDETYRINAIGPSYAIAAAWPVFLRQRSGRIVNVSTMGTLDPFAGFFAYAASKAAVNSMARSCAKEGRGHGIYAFAVAPGAVETPMLRAIFSESVLPRARCLAPEDVARVIVECATGRRDGQSGETIVLASP
jgi:3-oxoacyl-[acyl-carrier protein] reductase